MDRRRETKTIKKNEKIYSQCVVTAGSVDNGFCGLCFKTPISRYPKQVPKTARKELKNALRIGNGPAVVRSVINLSLADLAAPDSVNMVEQDIAMTASKVKDPATWAMLQLLRADVTDSVRWADSALVYTDALRRASVKEWREVMMAILYIFLLFTISLCPCAWICSHPTLCCRRCWNFIKESLRLICIGRCARESGMEQCR